MTQYLYCAHFNIQYSTWLLFGYSLAFGTFHISTTELNSTVHIV